MFSNGRKINLGYGTLSLLNFKSLLNVRRWFITAAVLVIAFFNQNTNAQDLILSDISIATEEHFFDRNSITAGPNFTITSSGDVILEAPTVVIKPEFIIIQGGKLLLLSNPSIVSLKPDESIVPSA